MSKVTAKVTVELEVAFDGCDPHLALHFPTGEVMRYNGNDDSPHLVVTATQDDRPHVVSHLTTAMTLLQWMVMDTLRLTRTMFHDDDEAP